MKPADFFAYSDYKELLADVIKRLPKRGYGQLHKLAQHLKVHSSLVSQVLSGPKDFSMEQGLGAARFFNFTARETEYLLLLIQIAKAGTQELRTFYERQAEKFQENASQVAGRITGASRLNEADLALYYSDWIYIAVWLATMMTDLKSAAGIASHLSVPRGDVETALDFLITAGLVAATDDGYEAKVMKTHVPASSPLARRHHVNWRLKAIEHASLTATDEVMFTAPMTLSKKDFIWLKAQILTLVEAASEVVKASPSEELACLNIDLFRV